MAQAPLTLRRWSRVEYQRLVDDGVFAREPIELIGGQLFVAEPQGAYHASLVGCVGDALRVVLPPGWIVRIQAPLALDEESAPEPDVAVVRGAHEDYRHAHPTQPVLVVEVAESSLTFDRHAKGSLYARARVPDYWIVNATAGVLEVYRDPMPDPGSPYAWRYASVTRWSRSERVTLLALPDASVPVAALLR